MKKNESIEYKPDDTVAEAADKSRKSFPLLFALHDPDEAEKDLILGLEESLGEERLLLRDVSDLSSACWEAFLSVGSWDCFRTRATGG